MLQEYRAVKARIDILSKELFKMSKTDPFETHDEALEGMYFARVVNGMPHGTEISDKTGRVAESWREQYRKDFHQQWKLFVLDKSNKEIELAVLKKQLDNIDTAISSLLQKEKDVVTLYYIHGVKWEDVGKRLNYEQGHCKRIRDRAIWYMSLSLFPRKVR
jgi:hypothetical protein